MRASKANIQNTILEAIGKASKEASIHSMLVLY